jgi:hypothetical protein
LTYHVGNTTVELTQYSTTADVFALDRVNNFSLGASGRNDHITVIGMTVVPEPASCVALAIGAAALFRRRFRKGNVGG